MWSNRKCVCQTILSSNRSWDFFFQFDFFAANSLVCASALSTRTNERKGCFLFIITSVVCDSMANRNGLVACFRCANLEQEINGHNTHHTQTHSCAAMHCDCMYDGELCVARLMVNTLAQHQKHLDLDKCGKCEWMCVCELLLKHFMCTINRIDNTRDDERRKNYAKFVSQIKLWYLMSMIERLAADFFSFRYNHTYSSIQKLFIEALHCRHLGLSVQ